VDSVAVVGLLAEPVRRRLYDYIAGRVEPVGRAEAAAKLRIARPLAAFHLDRLAEVGLLKVSYKRPPGRSGPGAGRPAKLYEIADTEHAVSLPPRSYELAADLLAETVTDLDGAAALAKAAHEKGRATASTVRSYPAAIALLKARGYRPYREDGVLRMRNCPFHHLATDHPPVICGMNLGLLDGLLEGWTATMDPRPGECCVALHRTDSKKNDN
jgi:predicted ArsR family transcriptional regulator